MISDKPVQISFKKLAPDEWPISMSKCQKKFHEHERCQGLHEHEVRRFKERGEWAKGQFKPKINDYET